MNTNQIQIDYITGNATYGELARKYGLSQGQVAYMAKQGNWPKKRKEYTEKVTDKALSQCAEAESSALAALTDTADKVADVFARLAGDDMQFCRYIVQEKNGTQTVSEEKIFQKRDVKSLREVTAALKDMVFVMRDLHGEPNVQDKAAMENARRKLLLEEGKRSETDGDSPCGVVLIPTAEEA